MPAESVLRRKIVKALTEHRGGMWITIHQSGTQTIGLPDIVGCLDGQFYGLEVKRPGRESTLTQRQAVILGRIRASGGRSGVITSVEHAFRFCDDPGYDGVVDLPQT